MVFSCVSVCVLTYYFYVFIVKTGGGGVMNLFTVHPLPSTWTVR